MKFATTPFFAHNSKSQKVIGIGPRARQHSSHRVHLKVNLVLVSFCSSGFSSFTSDFSSSTSGFSSSSGFSSFGSSIFSEFPFSWSFSEFFILP